MKTRVNTRFVGALIRPWWGLRDDDEVAEQYDAYDPNDEAEMRALIGRDLVPAFRRWDADSQEEAKLALRFLLSFRRERLGDIFYGVLPPLPPPDDPAVFFEWLWQELFGDEDPRLPGDDRDYEIRDVVHAVNLIKLAPEQPG